ncbi:class I SAM-dependent methyltransferase, partial [Klebsiella pneumoniae]|uniref:class I SAM-dependent methyltransferase n=1 Tax=Klebsiella pneumoniae TaxID=573 RepID=UPI0038549F7E
CFVQGDATRLPFPGGTFDHCWTQHVSMNISDKSALYSGMFRVLKAGGRLAIYDFVDGQGEPILYPVPWATVPEISF